MQGLKGALIVVGVLALFIVSALTVAIGVAYQGATASIVGSAVEVEPAGAALIFGASVQPDKKPSAILRDRIEAGVQLLKLKKVDRLLLSGDSREANYDEVGAMRRTAIGLGADPQALVLDHAGHRTYDSCYRARHVFGYENVVVVTQRFHLARAIFLCNAVGLKTQGLSSSRSSYSDAWKFALREAFAWALALFDTQLPRQPVSTAGSQPG